MKEQPGVDLEEEFAEGRIHMLPDYTLRFKKSLKKGDEMQVTCALAKTKSATVLISFSKFWFTMSSMLKRFSPAPVWKKDVSLFRHSCVVRYLTLRTNAAAFHLAARRAMTTLLSC